MNEQKKIHCFVAGGSGGHIIPCIALAQQKLLHNPHDHILFFTSNKNIDHMITKSLSDSYTVVRLPIMGITHINPFSLFITAISLMQSLYKSTYYLIRMRPISVTSTGGLCTLPVALVAYVLQIPLNIYELNVLPGKTTSFLAAYAQTIYCCFARTIDFLPNRKCQVSTYPIRQSLEKNIHADHHASDKKTILIIGGSQGSIFINQQIKQWILNQKNSTGLKNIQIIHQTGEHDPIDWKTFYAEQAITATTFSFSQNLEHYYTKADLIICRSGAGSLFEALHYKKPCITIPLELAYNSHQIHNAFSMAQLYPTLFYVATQHALLNNPNLLATMIDTILFSQGSIIKEFPKNHQANTRT